MLRFNIVAAFIWSYQVELGKLYSAQGDYNWGPNECKYLGARIGTKIS